MRNADRSCSVDGDCTIARNSVRCFADCGVAEPIAASAVDAVDSAVGSVEDTFCRRVETIDCPPADIPPCVPPSGEPTVACEQGECTVRYVEE
jgi:hypothetical protein